jgi:hypothetical protein
VVAVSGCSLLLDSDRLQCETDGDCAARGLESATCDTDVNICVEAEDLVWGCVGNVEWDEATSEPLVLNARFRRLSGETPVVGAPGKLCEPLDTDCLSPLDEAVTDENGVLSLTGYYGFRGYTLLEPPESYPNMAPAILWANPPRFDEVAAEDIQPAHLTAVDEVSGIAALLGTSVNPDAGHIFGLTSDCNQQPIGNVTLRSDVVGTDTVQYYFDGSIPSKTAAETDASGLGGFVNVPAGLVTITATSLDVGLLGSATVLVKPGHITYLGIGPTPQ